MAEKETLLGRGSSNVGRVAADVIPLNLDKHFHFGIAILILNMSPHFSVVLLCVYYIGCSEYMA